MAPASLATAWHCTGPRLCPRAPGISSPWLRAVLEQQDVLHLLVFSSKHLAERALDLNSAVRRLPPLRSHENLVKSPAFSHLHTQGRTPARLPRKLWAGGELNGATWGAMTKFLAVILTAVIRNQFKKKSVTYTPIQTCAWLLSLSCTSCSKNKGEGYF